MACRSLAGEVGPFDPEAVEISGHKKLFERSHTDPRLQFPGHFVSVGNDNFRKGEQAPMGEAKFTERRDAIATAYHFGYELALYTQATSSDMQFVTPEMLTPSGNIIGISSTGEFLEGHDSLRARIDAGTQEAFCDMRSMERAAANLAIRFGFDSTSVTTAAYQGERKGFSISLGSFGKLADFGADGSITLYGSDGTAYAARDYNALNVDGGIPELHNHEVYLKDQEPTGPASRPDAGAGSRRSRDTRAGAPPRRTRANPRRFHFAGTAPPPDRMRASRSRCRPSASAPAVWPAPRHGFSSKAPPRELRGKPLARCRRITTHRVGKVFRTTQFQRPARRRRSAPAPHGGKRWHPEGVPPLIVSQGERERIHRLRPDRWALSTERRAEQRPWRAATSHPLRPVRSVLSTERLGKAL